MQGNVQVYNVRIPVILPLRGGSSVTCWLQFHCLCLGSSNISGWSSSGFRIPREANLQEFRHAKSASFTVLQKEYSTIVPTSIRINRQDRQWPTQIPWQRLSAHINLSLSERNGLVSKEGDLSNRWFPVGFLLSPPQKGYRASKQATFAQARAAELLTEGGSTP